jgi:hypothetical protein
MPSRKSTTTRLRRLPAMTNIFSFVGTHRDNPDYLLLLGDDGTFYAVDDPDAVPTPVEPNDDWVFVAPVEIDDIPPPLS